MTVTHKATDLIERWGDRLLGQFVPQVRAAAAGGARFYCFCECHQICYRWCSGGMGQPVICGPCTDCQYTAGCSSCR
ncbi:hypothetical protein [Pseudonocardia sp. TRM90224]|uniref:hypothetical protein n=1 Tax=Pseudonocardia sp. TRM90224 TaxID=2812678 RepID=UPI001E32C35B|nr:hypothetical protein [Pseudonocardia sp. TRM90224]